MDQLHAWTVPLVTSVSMVPCSQQLALMVNITHLKTLLQVKNASHAQLVTTVSKELENLGHAPQALTKNFQDKLSAVIAHQALNAGNPK